MNRIKIRRAQISDAEVVAHLWHNYDLYEHHLDKRIEVVSEISYEKQFLEIMQNESSIVVLAECDSAVAGIIDYAVYSRGKLKIGTLGNLFVLDEFRGKGIGSELSEYVLNKIKRMECDFVNSGVRANNKEAQKFWEKRGFKIDFDSMANCSMRKELK